MMPEINEKIIQQKIWGSPRGIKSCFIKLDKKWGIKLFWDKDDRDQCYTNQGIAAEHGLGPDVGDTVDFSEGMDYPYGYITEVVQTIVPHNEVNNGICSSVFTKAQNSSRLTEKQLELKEKLDDLFGCYFTDLHPANLGYKNGQLICIDFGSEGMDEDFDHNNWHPNN
jgi:hypothetical protein